MNGGSRTERRIRGLRERMEGLDAVVATSLENTYYFSGSFLPTIRLIPNRLAMLVIPRDGEPTFLVCNIEESLVTRQSPLTDIRSYVEFAESPANLLAETLKEQGLENARIAFETQHLSSEDVQQMLSLLPGVRIAAADSLLHRIRAVKEPEEIDALRKGARVTEQAIYAAWSSARSGNTEREVSETIMVEMVRGGADTLSFMIFASGERCSLAHPTPGGHRIAPGEIVRVDVGGVFDNYYSDVARTGVVGRADGKQVHGYAAVQAGQEAIIEAMRPGTPVADLYRRCKRTVESNRIPFPAPHVGHSIGLGLHEEPIIHPFSEAILEEDMVFCVEPFVLVPGKEAYHVEDLVRVTPDGGQVLTDPEGLRRDLFQVSEDEG